MFFWWPLNHQKSMSVEQKLSWTLQPDALPPWYNNSLSGSTGVVALDNLPWSVLDLPPFDIIVYFIFHCLCCDFLCARHHDCTVFLLIFFHFYFPEFVIFFFCMHILFGCLWYVCFAHIATSMACIQYYC